MRKEKKERKGPEPEREAAARGAEPPAEVGEDEILPEYDFRGGVRGKYAARYAEGTNVVVLDPDVAEAFPTSAAVNSAWRALREIARRQVQGRAPAA